MVGEKRPRDAIAAASDEAICGVFCEGKNNQPQRGDGEGFEKPVDVFEFAKYAQHREIKQHDVPSSGKYKLETHQGHCTKNGGDPHPHQIGQNGDADGV